jgi:drug/metabolite transporter (DMT)-like permease
MNKLFAVAVIFIATFIGAIGAIFLKKGAKHIKLRVELTPENRFIIAGVFMYVVGILMYMLVLRALPLSIAYPLTSVSYLWIVLLSRKYLKEKIDIWRWAGIFLIIGGIVLLSLP